jgi:hypothetical protein
VKGVKDWVSIRWECDRGGEDVDVDGLVLMLS